MGVGGWVGGGVLFAVIAGLATELQVAPAAQDGEAPLDTRLASLEAGVAPLKTRAASRGARMSPASIWPVLPNCS